LATFTLLKLLEKNNSMEKKNETTPKYSKINIKKTRQKP